MRSYLRIHSPWSQFFIFILLLFGAFALTSIISIAVLLSNGISLSEIRNFDYNNPKVIGLLKLVQGISTITIFLLPAIAFSLVTFRFRQFYYLGFRKQDKTSFYLV